MYTFRPVLESKQSSFSVGSGLGFYVLRSRLRCYLKCRLCVSLNHNRIRYRINNIFTQMYIPSSERTQRRKNHDNILCVSFSFWKIKTFSQTQLTLRFIKNGFSPKKFFNLKFMKIFSRIRNIKRDFIEEETVNRQRDDILCMCVYMPCRIVECKIIQTKPNIMAIYKYPSCFS